jgi:2-dehydro-3-deoxyphosphogalactonate aldolase
VKIESVEAFIIENPPPRWGGNRFYFLKITTEDGLHGWGEMAFLGAQGDMLGALVQTIDQMAEAYLLGTDARRIEHAWQTLYTRAMCHHPDLVRMGIVSAVDTALWDLAGRRLGVPVCELLGGRVRERVRTYSYIYDDPDRTDREPFESWWQMWLTPELCAERAAEMADEGFNALKLDPIPPRGDYDGPSAPWQLGMEDLERAERTVRLVREAVGSRADILIGTHGQTTPAAMRRLARRLEPFDPLWLEEPVPPENAEAMAHVRRGTSIPIATGERLTTVHEFQRLFAAGAVDIAQPDPGSCGGISQMRKIAAAAEPHYVQLAPHVWGGPVMTAAALQVDLAVPNFLIQENIYDSRRTFDRLLTAGFEGAAGYLQPPERPGLGIELDQEALRELSAA